MKALVIRAAGGTHPVDLSDNGSQLSELQNLVGGFIEYVPTTQDVTLYCHEEGKILGLRPNHAATYAFGQAIAPDYLVGDVVVVGPMDDEGNNTSLDVEAWLSYIEEWTA